MTVGQQSLCACMCVCVCMFVCLGVHARVCACVCTCVCLCMCVCVCECEFLPITCNIRLRCHSTYICAYTQYPSSLFQFLHHSMSMISTNESSRIDSEEIIDNVDMYHSLDGFDYCMVPYDIPEVVPEESTSDDEMEITRTLSTSSSLDVDENIAEDEAKRGQCVLNCEEGKLEPHVRRSLYEDSLWRFQVRGTNVVYLQYVLYTMSISPVCKEYNVYISSM